METGETSAASSSTSATPCPAGLAVDGRGNLFVADAANGKILRVDAATGKVTTAVSGMVTPGDIAFDRQGDLFASEQGRNRVIAFGAIGDPSNLTLAAPSVFPAPCPQVSNPFTFCNEPQGGTSAQATFTLTNTSATTTLTGITITPAFVPANTQPPPAPTNFTNESTSCTATLNPGATCTINIAFTPLSTGAITGILTVTDNQGDSVSVNLAGTAGTFSLQLAGGQTSELTIPQGNTATFMAQIVPDNIYGEDGEKVSFSCPSNLPLFTNCSFNPCPVSITPGTTASFNIVFVTSSSTVSAPTITNPCNSTSSTAIARHAGTIILRVPPGSNPNGRDNLPMRTVLAMLAAICIALLASYFAVSARRSSATVTTRRRIPLIFAFAGICAILFIGCHHSGVVSSSATPVGTYSLTIFGNAIDANGNSLHASRSLTVTIDVIQQGTGINPF
jgi:hypothetical protein